MIERPVRGRRIVSQLKEVTMKRVARICGVLSVLFLGVCILACAAKRDQPAPRKDVEKAPAKEDKDKTETEAKEKSD